MTSLGGRFLVLEGIDGSGTTTQAAAVAAILRSRGHEVVETREPTDGPLGRLIRERLGAPDLRDPATLALLFAADRLDHVGHVIAPALARDAIVVCDRYVISSWVYQSLHCPAGWVRAINEQAPWPDLTVLLDASAEVAMARVDRRGAPREAYERRDLQERLCAGYRAVFSEAHPGLARVDGDRAPAAVTEAILARLRPLGL